MLSHVGQGSAKPSHQRLPCLSHPCAGSEERVKDCVKHLLEQVLSFLSLSLLHPGTGAKPGFAPVVAPQGRARARAASAASGRTSGVATVGRRMGRPTGGDAAGQAVPDALLLRQMTGMVGQSRLVGDRPRDAWLGCRSTHVEQGPALLMWLAGWLADSCCCCSFQHGRGVQGGSHLSLRFGPDPRTRLLSKHSQLRVPAHAQPGGRCLQRR